MKRFMGKTGAVILGFVVLAGFAFGQEKQDKDKPKDKKETPSLAISKAFKLSGYTQFQFTGQDRTAGADSLAVRRSRLSLGGDIMKKMHYKFQVEWAKSPTLLDASIEYEFSKAVQLRAGQFMVPFSLENLTGTADLDMINRSMPEEKLTPGRDNSSQGRDVGVAVFGSHSIVDYTVALLNGAGINKADTNSHKDLGARIVVKPVEYLSVGGSFYKGKQSASDADPLVTRDRAGLDVAFLYKSASLKAEYFHAKDAAVSKNGWYLQGGYFVLPKKVQALVKYETLDVNRNFDGDMTHRFSVGVNWILEKRTKLQLNYERYTLESGKTYNNAILAMLQVAY